MEDLRVQNTMIKPGRSPCTTVSLVSLPSIDVIPILRRQDSAAVVQSSGNAITIYRELLFTQFNMPEPPWALFITAKGVEVDVGDSAIGCKYGLC